MRVYKVELLIIDYDEIGKEAIKHELENTKYANRCILPSVMNIVGKTINNYSDAHPLNFTDTMQAAYKRLFKNDKNISR